MTYNIMMFKTDMKKLKDTWLSLLATKGCMLWHEDDGPDEAWWVASTSKHSVTVFKLNKEFCDGKRYWTFDHLDPEQTWKQITITNVHGWFCRDVCPVPPGIFRLRMQDDLAKPRICLFEDGPDLQLSKFAATQGFRGVTVPLMQKLWTLLTVNGPKPRLEAAIVRGLVEHHFPNAPDEEIVLYCERRHSSNESWLESIIDQADMDDVGDVVEPGDLPELEQTHTVLENKAAKEKQRRDNRARASTSASAQPAARNSGSGASSSGITRNPRAPVGFEGLDVAQAKLLIPQVKRCSIYKDMKEFRWQAHYPRDKPPYSCSQAFSIAGEAEALKFVLRTIWGWHVGAGGQPPTFDI